MRSEFLLADYTKIAHDQYGREPSIFDAGYILKDGSLIPYDNHGAVAHEILVQADSKHPDTFDDEDAEDDHYNMDIGLFMHKSGAIRLSSGGEGRPSREYISFDIPNGRPTSQQISTLKDAVLTAKEYDFYGSPSAVEVVERALRVPASSRARNTTVRDL